MQFPERLKTAAQNWWNHVDATWLSTQFYGWQSSESRFSDEEMSLRISSLWPFLSALGLCLNRFSSVPHPLSHLPVPLSPHSSPISVAFPFLPSAVKAVKIQTPSVVFSPRTFKKWWICAPASCPYSWKNSKGRSWLNFRLLPLICNISVSLQMIKVLLHLQHVNVLECTHKLSNMVFLYFWKQLYQLFWVLAKTLLSSIC